MPWSVTQTFPFLVHVETVGEVEPSRAEAAEEIPRRVEMENRGQGRGGASRSGCRRSGRTPRRCRLGDIDPSRSRPICALGSLPQLTPAW